MIKVFITATDTDAGKTFIGTALTYKLSEQYRVAVYKPISAGCDEHNGQLVNEDAQSLQAAANCGQSIENINPIAFKEPIAPHIAAANVGQSISVEQVQQGFEAVVALSADIILTEGAGGWRLPLGNHVFLSEFAKQSQQQVILVVNMKLGCLNHAMLTYEAIMNDGLTCVGWVANCQEQMPFLEHNIQELTELINAPMLGKVGLCESPQQAAQLLDVSSLIISLKR